MKPECYACKQKNAAFFIRLHPRLELKPICSECRETPWRKRLPTTSLENGMNEYVIQRVQQS